MNTPMHKTLDVVSLGEAMIEFNQVDQGRPDYLQGYGGDTSNATIAAARAGACCAYLTRVGEDAFGAMLLRLWQQENVNTSAVQTTAGQATGLYFVSHGTAGHAFSYLRAGSAASRMTPDWLREGASSELIQASRFLHVSGISMGISASACDTVFEAIGLARAHGTQVSLDANLRLKLWPLARARACLVEALRHTDLFLPSLDDAVHLCASEDPDRIVDWSHGAGARVVVLKLGAGGALVSDGSRRLRIAGRAVPLVDATGAGDCFCGNLLARLARSLDVFEAAQAANVAASLAVQGYGAVAPLPTAEAVASALLADSGNA